MNYCQAGGNVSGALTALDVRGLRKAYSFPLVDFNSDRRTDILWHNDSSGATQAWHMDGATRSSYTDMSSSLNVSSSGGWILAATNDFNLDGKVDLLWHNGSTGASQLWYMDGLSRTSYSDFSSSLDTADSTGWRIVGSADLNSDGKTDVLWHNGSTGATQAWYMDGVSRSGVGNLDSSLDLADSTNWKCVGIGDFNVDGQQDLLWHNGSTGASQVWYMNGIARTSYADLSSSLNIADSTGWRVSGVRDFNHDGNFDILWHNGTSGETQIWYMNGVSRTSSASVSSSLNLQDSSGWRIAPQ
jgi:hypothetical protein